MSDVDLTALRRALLRWYRRSGRALPWRAAPGEHPPAYHTLVSETMLQQTQVATVIDYFHRFMAAFPKIEALARAKEERVLRLWQGLGYYRRARHLHAAARQIVAEHGGRVPDNVATLLKLPGVGRYTAGAIASIAYGKREPIVDGNVARVLARWFTLKVPIDEPATRARLWELAEQMLPTRHAGDLNQAMMDLGATICVPRVPRCDACAVSRWCGAYRRGQAEALPVTRPRRAPRAVTHHMVALHRRGRYLWRQRPGTGLWAKLWELPTAEQVAAAELDAWVRQQTGLEVTGLEAVGTFTHQTTHRTVRFEVWHASRCSGRARAGVWRALDEVGDLPRGGPWRRVVQVLGNGRA